MDRKCRTIGQDTDKHHENQNRHEITTGVRWELQETEEERQRIFSCKGEKYKHNNAKKQLRLIIHNVKDVNKLLN
jgi:hypothetical protein